MDKPGDRISAEVLRLRAEETDFGPAIQQLAEATGINCSMASQNRAFAELLKQISEDAALMVAISNIKAHGIEVRFGIGNHICSDGVVLDWQSSLANIHAFLLRQA